MALLPLGCHRSTRQDTVVMAWESFPLSLDPRTGQDQASQRLLALTHQGLLKRNRELELVPDGCLAWRWERPYTQLSFDFPTAEAAQGLGRSWFWFDASRPLGAADALDALDALRDPGLASSKAGPFKEEIEDIQLSRRGDVEVLTIRLRAPNPGFAANLVRGVLGIAPAGARGPSLPGTGPYRILGFEPERRIRLEAKPDHRDFRSLPEAPLNLELRLMPDANTRYLALRHGTIQACLNNLPPDLLKPGQGFEVHRTPGSNLEYVAFHCGHPVLGNARVRLALALALDRQLMVDGLLGGRGREAWAFFPPELPQGTDGRPSLSIPQGKGARLRLAEALLDAAGHPRNQKGLRFTLRLSSTPEVSARLKALALQAQWREIGVETEVLTREFGTLLTEVMAGKFEVVSLRWVGAPDPDMLYQVFHSTMTPPRGFNRGRFEDPATDRLLEASRRAATPEERLALLKEAQHRLLLQSPYAFLWWPDQVAVLAPGLEIDLNAVGDFTGIWRQGRPRP